MSGGGGREKFQASGARAHLSFLQTSAVKRPPGGRPENSPALECWVGRGDRSESRRDERDTGARILSSLRDLPFSRAPTQHSSAGLFSIVPAGRAPIQERHCQKLRCAQSSKPKGMNKRVCVRVGDVARASRTAVARGFPACAAFAWREVGIDGAPPIGNRRHGRGGLRYVSSARAGLVADFRSRRWGGFSLL